MKRIRVLLTALAIALLVAGCSAAAGETPTADESPVPDGMPVMYEFFTTS